MRMRRTGPEPADAYGHPTGGTYTLGVGRSRSHPPRPKHPRPSRRPECPGGARAAGPRFGDHLQVLTDKFTAHSTAGTPAGPRGEGEPGSILRRSRYTGLARGPHGAAGTPDWPAGGGREGRAGQRGAPPYGSAGTPDWREGPYGTAGTPDWPEGRGGRRGRTKNRIFFVFQNENARGNKNKTSTRKNKQTYEYYLQQTGVRTLHTRGLSNKNNHKTQTHKLALKTYTASHTLNVSILVAL